MATMRHIGDLYCAMPNSPDTDLGGNRMPKITPFLWFDDNAEEAVGFYTSIFKNSRVTSVTRYGKESAEVSGRPQGTVMTMAFQAERTAPQWFSKAL